KVRNGDTYTVTVRIPADAEAGVLEFYASTSTNFTADDSTLVGKVAYKPGETVTFTFTKPGSEHYVATRSLDASGNTSAFAAENAVRVRASDGSSTGGTVGDAATTTDEE